MMFVRRYNLKPRSQPDDKLRDFPDEPVAMPPISCLLQGCESVWMNSVQDFNRHCDDRHEGVQSYRLRCLHLLSETVWQMKGSIQRAALQNFAEFQVRGATSWDGFSQDMQAELDTDNGQLPRENRWAPRRWQACVVCAEGRWSEELHALWLTGPKCSFKKPEHVADLLDPEKYIQMWPNVPAEEVRRSSVKVPIAGKLISRCMLLHSRRIDHDALKGKSSVNVCSTCHGCLVKDNPEMPVRALANGKWLGRHPEIMRSMPHGHRLLLPVRRVIATKVIFTSDPRNPWERTHSAQGLHGVTTIVEQAPALPAVREFPPSNLGDSFEAVFTGLDPEDRRKAQTLPIHKELLLRQIDFLKKHSLAHQDAKYNADQVRDMNDGETPRVISDNFVDLPPTEDIAEDDAEPADSSKYRGPADATIGARETGEDRENMPVTFLCHDNLPLDKTTCWQVAASKLELMERQAKAVQREEELSEGLTDKAGRTKLFQSAREFKAAVGVLSTENTKAHIEAALQAEPTPHGNSGSESSAASSADKTSPSAHIESEPSRSSDALWEGSARLVVPTRQKYANMWQHTFWQEWDPMDWCYGDCVYGDPKLNEKPYKQTSYQDWCKHIHLREELEYDMYEGENYKACNYGREHWQHRPDVGSLLEQFEKTLRQEVRDLPADPAEIFQANRFRKCHACRMVLSTFWRLMSGFMAVNVGLRIPGVQSKLKTLAQLPEQLQILSAKTSEQDGMASLIRRALHLFDLIMGKVVGSNGFLAAIVRSVQRDVYTVSVYHLHIFVKQQQFFWGSRVSVTGLGVCLSLSVLHSDTFSRFPYASTDITHHSK